MSNNPILDAKNILLIHYSGRIGDSLLGTPCIVAIQNFSPLAKIDLMVHRNRLELFENIPGVNLIGPISNRSSRWRGWFNIVKYDYVFVFNYYEPLNKIVEYALRVGKKVIAFETPDNRINKKLFVCEPKTNIPEHSVNGYLKLLNSFKVNPSNRRVKFFVKSDEIFEADNFLKNNLIDSGKYLVGIKTSTLRSFRDWPVNHFIELSEKIKTKRSDVHFILFDGSDDKTKITLFKKTVGEEYCTDVCSLSLRVTAAVMSKINLYIGVDTGPGHLMSSFNVPFVGLYHNSLSSSFYGPLDHPCCVLIDSPLNSDENSSMSDISVDFVYRSLERFLENNPTDVDALFETGV